MSKYQHACEEHGWRRVQRQFGLCGQFSAEQAKCFDEASAEIGDQEHFVPFYNVYDGQFSDQPTWFDLAESIGLQPIPRGWKLPIEVLESDHTREAFIIRGATMDENPQVSGYAANHTFVRYEGGVLSFTAPQNTHRIKVPACLEGEKKFLSEHADGYSISLVQYAAARCVRPESKPQDEILELNLRFTNPHPAVIKMAEVLREAADPAPGTEKAGENPLRRMIVRYVVIAARHLGRKEQTVWIEMYHEVFKEFRVHPVVASYEKKYSSHLEALMEIPGGPEFAMDHLTNLIQS